VWRLSVERLVQQTIEQGEGILRLAPTWVPRPSAGAWSLSEGFVTNIFGKSSRAHSDHHYRHSRKHLAVYEPRVKMARAHVSETTTRDARERGCRYYFRLSQRAKKRGMVLGGRRVSAERFAEIGAQGRERRHRRLHHSHQV